ncbi:MAG TPA: PilC/PilY family type IV pilus protein [Plasticicumulans sp.]|nr:PilC/PilY family type IV pilus protein [Plasticicumulans sp.]
MSVRCIRPPKPSSLCVLLLLFAGLLLPGPAAALNLAQAPIYQAPPRKPLVLLSMSKDHTLFYKAYDDYSDLDSDGVADTTYRNAITYYGYFDSLKCYSYDTTNQRFEPAAASSDHYCSGTTWSGNFLNWVSMARIDVVRKVLYGGRRSTDTADATVSSTSYSTTSSTGAPSTTTSSPTACDNHGSNANCPAASTTTATSAACPTNVAGTCTQTTTTTVVSNCGSSSNSCWYRTAVTTTTTTYVTTATTTSTVTPGIVVLERSYLPNDAHSWSKVYAPSGTSDIGRLTPLGARASISICNTTYAASGSYSQRVDTAAYPPVMRFAAGEFPDWAAQEVRQCQTGVSGSPGSSALIGDYAARVRVCVPGSGTGGLGGEKCKQYPDGSYRPVGVLQDYGDDDQMYFGLMLGTYGGNKSGGALRKNIASWRGDEINLQTGQFLATPSTGSIRAALDALRLFGYKHGGSYTDSYNSGNGGDACGLASNTDPLNSFTEGNCSTWGNPIAELTLEAMRYFAGLRYSTSSTANGLSPTTAFNKDDSARFADLKLVSWQNPASSDQYKCSPASLIAINSGVSSYDSDQLGGFSDLGISGTLSGYTDAIGAAEGISSSGTPLFVGEFGSSTDRRCTAKTVTALSGVKGPCPEAPRLSGSYQIAGLANAAHTAGVGGRKVDFFGVSMAPPVPKVTIPVPASTRTVTILPACKDSNNDSACTIVDFRILSQTATAGQYAGRVSVVWEDGEQGNDYDEDMKGTIDYVVTSNTVTVTTWIDYANAGHTLGFGYIISGTSQDGFHAHSGHNTFRYTDATGVRDCSAGCSVSSPAVQTAQTYTISGTAAGTLRAPLYYAAKWGGFRDRNSNGRPDDGEWEDHFFDVKNPGELSPALSRLFASVAAGDPSSAALSANVRTLQTSALLFQASYNPADWSGEVKAYGIDAATGALSGLIWKASDHLPATASRNIVTWRPGSGGIAFTWTNLDSTQKAALGNDSTLLDWLRGDQSREGTASNQLRVRTTRLGDVVNSDPVFAGVSDAGYGRLPGSEGASYAAWVTAKESLAQMVYVGANDGMLHGFDATTGSERLAYVPNAVFGRLAGLTARSYSHVYSVDGAPAVGDVHDGSRWRTLLAGTLGAGGKAVFGLDVSDPATFGPGNVLWEFTDADLGEGVRQALIVRTHDSAHPWVVLFGNGYNGTSGNAVLYALDALSGVQLAKIVLPVSGASGLATPVAWDADGDLVTDAVYAGDLLGNLWKFDLSGSAGGWRVALGGQPLFTARGPTGLAQPITVQPTVGKGKDGVVRVFFGTGKYLEASDGQIETSPAVQSFYGLVDAGSSITYISRSSVLTAQTLIAEFPAGTNGPYPLRVSSDNTPADGAKGWYLDLVPPNGVAAGERVVERAVIRYDRIVFPTMLPLASAGCSGGGDGWLMEVLSASGGRPKTASFDLNNDGRFDGSDGVTINGELVVVTGINPQVGVISGAPAVVVGAKSETKWVTGSAGGTPFSVGERIDARSTGRQSWIQLQ